MGEVQGELNIKLFSNIVRVIKINTYFILYLCNKNCIIIKI